MGMVKKLYKMMRDHDRAKRAARRQILEAEKARMLIEQENQFNEHEAQTFQVLWDEFESCAKRRICYFSSFDADGLVDDHVLFHLSALKAAGIDIVFISTSPSLDACWVDKLKPHVTTIIHRNNVGLDFFSWKIGMKAFPFGESTEQVFLVNDSVYGPLFPLAGVMEQMNQKNLDIWGITDSWYIQYHLQSYFICINLSERKAMLLNHFFDQVKIIHDKEKFIVEYEMGLTRMFLSAGCKAGALCDFRKIYSRFYSDEIGEYRLQNYSFLTNQTLRFWKELVADRLSPYLKTSILRENYLNEVEPRHLEALFEYAESALSIEIVLDHQKRVSKGQFP